MFLALDAAGLQTLQIPEPSALGASSPVTKTVSANHPRGRGRSGDRAMLNVGLVVAMTPTAIVLYGKHRLGQRVRFRVNKYRNASL
jgi:hypothetical protein